MFIKRGRTGIIHGIEVRARSQAHEPTVKVAANSADGKKAVLRAARSVYETHQAVIRALASR